MKIEDFKSFRNFLPPDTPVDIETEQIKIKDYDKFVTSSGSIAEEVRRMIIVNIERKVLEGFADDLIKWAKDIHDKKINKSIIIDVEEPVYTIKTSSEHESGTITLVNKKGRLSKPYNVINDRNDIIKEAILDMVLNPSIYPSRTPNVVPAV